MIRFNTHFGGDVSEVVGIVAHIPLGFGLLCRRIGFGAHTRHLHVDYCRFSPAGARNAGRWSTPSGRGRYAAPRTTSSRSWRSYALDDFDGCMFEDVGTGTWIAGWCRLTLGVLDPGRLWAPNCYFCIWVSWLLGVLGTIVCAPIVYHISHHIPCKSQHEHGKVVDEGTEPTRLFHVHDLRTTSEVKFEGTPTGKGGRRQPGRIR